MEGQFDPPFLFQEELIQYQYNFIQILNNLFKLGWGKKNANIICYMLTSLVYLEQANIKKPKLMKIVHIDAENLHIFQTTWRISMEFSRKMFLIVLKFAKKQGR